MENRKYLNLDELYVWSDNPRLGPQDGEAFSEQEVINILIDVVGIYKMYNLISDIFASKKLMGNVNPVVVPKNDKYFVYDGNRRVSALKILKNPSLIENEKLRLKVERLINNEDVSFADRVFVYITDEKEALEILDKTHIGEEKGIGMISWEPYQRDYSLFRRKKTLKYPYAFSIARALNYDVNSFNTISYTDLDRLFGSSVLREKFHLSEENNDYATKAEYIIGMLKKYKEKKRFRSFSRQFDITASNVEDGPMLEFCRWVDEQEKNKKNFYFKTCPVELFTDQQFSFSLLRLQILDSQKNEIPYKLEELNIRYKNPNGIDTDSLDVTDIGIWEVHIEYNGESHSENITTKKLLAPRIDFDSRKYFGLGNTIDLRKLIIRATDGHGCNRIYDVNISAVGQVEIINNIFTVNNPCGTYQIAYSFHDVTGAPYSTTKEIRIIDKSSPLLAENKSIPLLSFHGTCNLINISDVVNRLVNEINRLDFQENICVITIALRTLLELSFDELHTRGKLIFSLKKDLEKCIEEFKDYLLNKKGLEKICSLYYKDLPSFQNEKNCVNLIDPSIISSFLNLSAHKSIARIDITKIAEIARKSIAPILVYISLILR